MADGIKSQRGLKALGWEDLARTSLILGSTAVLIACVDLVDPTTLEFPWEWIGVVSTVFLSWLGLAKSRFEFRWRKIQSDSVGDRSKTSGNFVEQFCYQFMALGLLCFAAFGNNPGTISWPWKIDLGQSWQISLFSICLIGSFSPLLFAFRRHDNLLRDGQYLDQIDSDHISDGSIWISVLIVGLLSCLAWAAGKQLIDLDGWYGPAVMAIVVFLFLVFIFMPALARATMSSGVHSSTAAAGVAISVGKIASSIDTLFALRLAPLTGATQTGRIPPHLILLLVFLPLTIMGYALENGWGLLPIFVAFLLAVSLGRRWAWVENDRETAMRIQKTKGRGIRIGFINDLRDEALLGYAFLFVLVPLALRQIQMIASPFEFETGAMTASATLTDWASFFGTELAKAVPIVDWADIYGLENDAAIQAKTETARHLVFFSRIMVDAIIIAALLQAWSIMQRNKSQRDLFNNGQLDLLDPFAERALFEREVRETNDGFEFSARLKELFEKRTKLTQEIRGTAVPYDQTRLNELVHSDEPKLKAVANYIVHEYGVLAGSSRERLSQLRDRWDSAGESKWECNSWVRDQRLVFERLMDEAHDSSNTWQITLVEESCENLSALLARVNSLQEFINAKKAAFELLGERATLASVRALAGRLYPAPNVGIPEFVKEALGNLENDASFAREPLQERRAEVAIALGRIYHSGDGAASRLAKKILEWIENNEAQQPVSVARSVLVESPSAPCNGKCCPMSRK